MEKKQNQYGFDDLESPKPSTGRQVYRPGTGNVHSVPPVDSHRIYHRAAPDEPTQHRASEPLRRTAQSAPRAQVSEREILRHSPYGGRTEADPRALGRKIRAKRRQKRRLAVLGTAVGVLLLAAVMTALLPGKKAEPEVPVATAEQTQVSLIAPLPYAGAGQDATGDSAQSNVPNWGSVGPVRQTENFVFTQAQAKTAQLPEFGSVDMSWFSDAAFLGDSLTEGFTEFEIDAGGALICGYVGASPNQVVNRATLTNGNGSEEVPLDVLAQAAPKKLYLLMGTNSLVGTGNDETFLSYYGQMLDDLRQILPDTMIFVQSVLPVRPEALEKAPGLASDRVASINASLLALCQEKGCYYLDLAAAFTDDTGALSTDYAEQDGIHLLTKGYSTWLEYLCKHVPYSKNNPYRAGSTYYLEDSVKSLLSDLS
jgi:lysophospholipase L1-like esterase